MEPETKPATRAEQFLIAVRFADIGILPNSLVRAAGVAGIPVLKRRRWVRHCAKKVSDALFPKVKERASFIAKGEAYEAGFAAGLVDAGLRLLNEAVERFGSWPKLREPRDEEVRNGLRFLFGEHGDYLFEVYKDDGAAFCAGVEEYEGKLSVSELGDYRQGQMDADRMLAGKNRKNDATDIYLFMLLYWRVVGGLEGVDHLHYVLTKVFGSNRVGEVKRVAQICQRVHLKYRGCGQPRKQPQRPWRLR